MNIRDTFLGLCLGFTTAAVATTVPENWIREAVLVRLPQSEIVRHPVDNGKYYLCWTDGTSRYGVAFRRSQLDIQIRSIPRAGRVSVASLMAAPSEGAPVIAKWTPEDARVCWPW